MALPSTLSLRGADWRETVHKRAEVHAAALQARARGQYYAVGSMALLDRLGRPAQGDMSPWRRRIAGALGMTVVRVRATRPIEMDHGVLDGQTSTDKWVLSERTEYRKGEKPERTWSITYSVDTGDDAWVTGGDMLTSRTIDPCAPINYNSVADPLLAAHTARIDAYGEALVRLAGELKAPMPVDYTPGLTLAH